MAGKKSRKTRRPWNKLSVQERQRRGTYQRCRDPRRRAAEDLEKSAADAVMAPYLEGLTGAAWKEARNRLAWEMLYRMDDRPVIEPVDVGALQAWMIILAKALHGPHRAWRTQQEVNDESAQVRALEKACQWRYR